MKTLKQVEISYKKVDLIPEQMEQGVIYISDKYGVANHLCLCGCGKQTVMPLGVNEWNYTEDNGKISFSPSVGNYQFPCRSHYIITKSKANFV